MKHDAVDESTESDAKEDPRRKIRGGGAIAIALIPLLLAARGPRADADMRSHYVLIARASSAKPAEDSPCHRP